DDKHRQNQGDENEGMAKEQLKEILKEMIKCQEQMKGFIKDLTQELGTTALSFHETCRRVKQVQPADPLESRGLKVMDFDKLLLKHQHDSDVRDAIAKIMGAPNPTNAVSDKIQSISVKDIIDIHTFMLQELQQLIKEYTDSESKEAFDTKTVTIAAQAIIGSKFETQFSLTSEDVESAVLMYHANLATDQNFAQINIKISHAMPASGNSLYTQLIFECGEHKWVTVHGSGQLNFSELLVPPALMVQLMFVKPEQMQMTLESEEVRRCELQKAKAEITHLREYVQRLEKSSRFVRCDEKTEVQDLTSSDETARAEAVHNQNFQPCIDTVPPLQQQQLPQQQDEGIVRSEDVPPSSCAEADAIHGAEAGDAEKTQKVDGECETHCPSTASKGSYVRAADKVYWVSYEDPLQLIRLPNAEPMQNSKTTRAQDDAVHDDTAQAVLSSSRQHSKREEVLLPGTPEKLPRTALRQPSADRCFSARGKLQGHGMAVLQVPTPRTIAQRPPYAFVHQMPHQVYSAWQKHETLPRRASSTHSLHARHSLLQRQRSGSLQSMRCLHPSELGPFSQRLPPRVYCRPLLATMPPQLRACSSSRSCSEELRGYQRLGQ
ncbi:unnamed protein product, partial [Symbiodinium pilosum]